MGDGGSSGMFSDSPPDQQQDQSTGGMDETASQAQAQKQTSFLAQHKDLTEKMQAMAQAFPEFAPFIGKMMGISKQGLVEAVGAMSRAKGAEKVRAFGA